MGVWVAWGSAHDPAPLAGATHLVEHLTLRRCGGRDRRELARLIDRLGGEVDAWTAPEMMGVGVQTTADAVPEALDLMADAVLAPTFDPGDVELERRVTLAELELVRDDPAEQVGEEVLRAVWGEHPLARPVIGTPETVTAVSPGQLAEHHRRLVGEGRLLAVVVGDVDAGEVEDRLRRLPLARRPAFPQLAPVRTAARHLLTTREGIDQVHARLAFPAVAAGDPRSPVVAVTDRILGAGASSRLFQRLREGEGLTYDVWSAATANSLAGLFEVGWTCSADAFPDTVRVVREEIGRFPETVTAEEVDVARSGLVRGLEMDRESPGPVSALLASELLERGRLFDPDRAVAELGAVTLGDVSGLAAEAFRLDRMASAVVAPAGSGFTVG